MLRRAGTWITLALAGLCLAFAALLIRPPEIYELLVGFVAGTLGELQWPLILAAAILLVASTALDRPPSSKRRVSRVSLAAVAALIATIVLVRDHRTFTRDTIALRSGDVELQGTMYRPRGLATVRPAILLLHGSGPNKRNAYHMMARRFVDHGFIVLNVDKRGVGGSGGTYYGDDLRQPVIERRAADARAALAYLAAQPGVDTARIGVFAISQGGWVVPLLLAGDSPARYAIAFSGPAVSSAEEGRWSRWAGEDLDHFGFRPPLVPFAELDQRIRTVVPGEFDPRPSLARMTAPSLWLYGEWDSSAPTSASLRVLDSLKTANVPVTARVFPEANHGLFVVRGPRGSRLANFAEGVWDSVFAWTAREKIVQLAGQE